MLTNFMACRFFGAYQDRIGISERIGWSGVRFLTILIKMYGNSRLCSEVCMKINNCSQPGRGWGGFEQSQWIPLSPLLASVAEHRASNIKYIYLPYYSLFFAM